MRAFLVILLALMGSASYAQESLPAEGGAPVVATEAPVLQAAPEATAPLSLPQEDNAPVIPSVDPAPTAQAPTTDAPAPQAPTDVAPGAQAPTDLAPAAPAPLAETPSAAPGDAAPPLTLTAESAGPEGAAALAAEAEFEPLPAAPEGLAALLPAGGELTHLFLDAHWVVQAVMIGLLVAAFVALVILIHKTFEFALAFAKLRRVAKVLARARSLDEAEAAVRGKRDPGTAMIRAANEELRLAEAEPALRRGLRERTHATLIRIDAGAAHRLRSGTGVLASIGSLSPFIGLFGTVFGIMNSFLAIAESKTTNLAVVAPGIAEALLATAIGLLAAIPAVLIYNICNRRLAKYRLRLADIATATEGLQSRALDRLTAGA